MLEQIRDVFRNSTPAGLAGDFVGAACILSAPFGMLFIALAFQ